MKINHLALYVEDLEAMKEFYCRFFGGQLDDTPYHNPRTGLRTYFLTFGDGARLELMNRPDMTALPKPTARTGYIHVCFSVGSKDAVDTLTAALKQNGYAVVSGPRTTGDGYYESCVLDPEQNTVEITV